MTDSDDYWTVVVKNLWKAQNIWSLLSIILVREVASPRVPGVLVKAVMQAVLILGVETWVVTPYIGRALRGSNTGSRDVSWLGSPSGY